MSSASVGFVFNYVKREGAVPGHCQLLTRALYLPLSTVSWEASAHHLTIMTQHQHIVTLHSQMSLKSWRPGSVVWKLIAGLWGHQWHLVSDSEINWDNIATIIHEELEKGTEISYSGQRRDLGCTLEQRPSSINRYFVTLFMMICDLFFSENANGKRT